MNQSRENKSKFFKIPSKDLDVLLREKPDSFDFCYTIGTKWQTTGDFLAAIPWFELAIIKIDTDLAAKQGDSVKASCYYNLGQCQLQIEQFKQAETHFQTALALYPDKPVEQANCYYGVGYCQLQQNNHLTEAQTSLQEALKLYSEQRMLNEQAKAALYLGLYFKQARNYDAMLDYLKKAKALYTAQERPVKMPVEVSNEILSFCHEQGLRKKAQAKFSHAINWLTLAIWIDSVNSADVSVKASCYYNLGQCQLQIEQFKQAETHFQTALALYPDKPVEQANCYYGVGYCQLQQNNRLTEAQTSFQEALKLYSEQRMLDEQAKTALYLGLCFKLGRDYNKALSYLEEAIQGYLSPLQSVLEKEKEYAIDYLSALEKGGEYALALMGKAMCAYHTEKDYPSAIRCFEQAVAINDKRDLFKRVEFYEEGWANLDDLQFFHFLEDHIDEDTREIMIDSLLANPNGSDSKEDNTSTETSDYKNFRL